MPSSKIVGTPRERLLAAANELFYAEGLHTVGIDRVIERAGVAKASLYSTFGCKDELVRAYLEQRCQRRQARLLERIAKHEDPREKILSVYELLGELFAEPTFRGCAFMKASAEEPVGEKIRGVCNDYRTWLLNLLTQLAREADADDPDELAKHLLVLHDGATFGATMDGDATRATNARKLVEVLLQVHTRAPKKRPRR
jgi:AcrR family transcriptional regulator